jgi:2'-5' RNA ligase
MLIKRTEVRESGELARALTDLTQLARDALDPLAIVYVEMASDGLVDTVTLYESTLTDGSPVYNIVLESLRSVRVPRVGFTS